MQRRVVDEESVGLLSVLAKTFAMIAGKYDNGVLVKSFALRKQSAVPLASRQMRFRHRKDDLYIRRGKGSGGR